MVRVERELRALRSIWGIARTLEQQGHPDVAEELDHVRKS